MNSLDVIVLGLTTLWLAGSIRFLHRKKKRGCRGCHGCHGCDGCDDCRDI